MGVHVNVEHGAAYCPLPGNTHVVRGSCVDCFPGYLVLCVVLTEYLNTTSHQLNAPPPRRRRRHLANTTLLLKFQVTRRGAVSIYCT